jgi:zinc transporter, ZIP family
MRPSWRDLPTSPDYPLWLQAAFWGLLAGSALLIGAAVGWFVPLSKRIVASITAFGAGVLISALAFDLMEGAYERGGFDSTVPGFLVGAAIYTAANWLVSRRNKKLMHRKRSGAMQPTEAEDPGSGTALAAGALIDGIPESIAIGASVMASTPVGWVTVLAIFVSNIPESLSSSAGMKRAGRSRKYVFGIWFGIMIASGVAAAVGSVVLRGAPADVLAAITAIAAGGILAMLVDTMIPEAFETAHELAGLITVAGFLIAFVLSKMEK